MNNLTDVRNIKINIDLKSKEEVLNYLSTLAATSGVVDNKEDFLSSLYEREELMSTYIGDKFAIPHAKSDKIKKPVVLMLLLKEPISWTANNDQVDFIVSLGIPSESHDNTHIKLISKVARMLMNEKIVSNIKSSNDVNEIKEIIDTYTSTI